MTWGKQNTEAEAHQQLSYAWDMVGVGVGVWVCGCGCGRGGEAGGGGGGGGGVLGGRMNGVNSWAGVRGSARGRG